MASTILRASRGVGRSLPYAAGRVPAAPLTQSRKTSPLIPIFIFSLALPIVFHLGSLRMSPYRVVLVATLIPCLVTWLSGSVGRIRLPDILMLLAATWGAFVVVNQHGVDQGLQSAGIFFIETFGTFLFARRYIRDVFAFQRMVRCLVLMVLFLLPFAAYENVTGSPILIELFGKIFSVLGIANDEPRWGLRRAQGPFDHFILFGVVCSSAFALGFYVFGAAKRVGGRLASGVVAMAVFSSLSSGALLSLVIQAMLIAWDKITASVSRRWAILATLVIFIYLAVDLFSNRTPIDVFISYLTFNADTSYMRKHIWNYGTQAVMQYPILGHGLNDWARPEWLGGSIDNFWLVSAVRYGIPGFVLMAAAFLSICFGLGRLRKLPFEVAQCRKALIITLCGLGFSSCTVHLWNAAYVLFIFLLGSGMWMHEHRNHPTRKGVIPVVPLARGNNFWNTR